MQENRSYKGLVIGAVVIVLALAGLAAFALSNQKQPTDTEQPTTTADTAATGETATITYTDNGFEPSSTSVKKSTAITVKNASSRDIQLSSADHPSHTKQAELNMAVLAPGESGTITVTHVGTWGYHDHLDDSKTGVIVVEE
jgi:plastocyanin